MQCCGKDSPRYAIDTDIIPVVDVGGTHQKMTSRQVFKAMGLTGTPAATDLHYYASGGWQKLGSHENAWHIFYVIEGQGEYQVGDETYKIRKGSVVYVPPGAQHAVKNTGEGELAMLFVAGRA
jgi:mannose-6-phosphate isomerase-like protein (cupin superfamily)